MKAKKKIYAWLICLMILFGASQYVEVVKAAQILNASTGSLIPYTEVEEKDEFGTFTVTGEVARYSFPAYDWWLDDIVLNHHTGYMYKIDPPEGSVYSLKIEYIGTDDTAELDGKMYYPMDMESGEFCLTESLFEVNSDDRVEVFEISDVAYLCLKDIDWSNVRFTLSKTQNISTLKNSAVAITEKGTVEGTVSELGYVYNSKNYSRKGFLLKVTLAPGEGYAVCASYDYKIDTDLMAFTENDLGVSVMSYEGTDGLLPVYNSTSKEATYYIWVSAYREIEGSVPIMVYEIGYISDKKAIPITIDGNKTPVENTDAEVNVLKEHVDDDLNTYYELVELKGQVYSVELPANSAYTLRYEYTGEKIKNDFTFVSDLYVANDENVIIRDLYLTDTIYDDGRDGTFVECRLVNTENVPKRFYLLPTGNFTEGKVLVSVNSMPDVKVSYRTHIQSIGWEAAENDISQWKSDGAMSGTSGMAKRLEGINIVVNSAEANENVALAIHYTTHCQSYGWLPWSTSGEMNGTEGEAKRLEAIMIKLAGMDSECYDIYYRVHAQSYGWLGWAKNGEPAGTAGYGKRLEGIQIVVVPRGESFDKNMEGIASARPEAFVAKEGNSPIVNYPATSNTNPVVPGEGTINVAYRTHVQSFGWQGWKYNGQMSGTSGKAKRLEGINIKLTNQICSGDIVYTTHVQSYGWQGKLDDKSTWKKNGEMSGTSGEAKRLEAICIDLTGAMGENYDIYYRVHAQSYGWLGWVSNGAPAGTAGYGKRLEGIQIVLVPKGSGMPANNYQEITSVKTEGYISR